MTDDGLHLLVWQHVLEVVMDHLGGRRADVHERLGMSFIKVKALRRLTSGPMTMGQLAAALTSDPPYTSVVIKDLVRRGLVVRTADADDRRRKLVGLTAEGVRQAEIADALLDQPPTGFADLSAAELGALNSVFERIERRAVRTS